MAWHLFLDNAWRVRVGGLAYVAGIDDSRALARLIDAGIDREIAEDLLGACEAGFVKAANEREEDSGQQD